VYETLKDAVVIEVPFGVMGVASTFITPFNADEGMVTADVTVPAVGFAVAYKSVSALDAVAELKLMDHVNAHLLGSLVANFPVVDKCVEVNVVTYAFPNV